MKAILIILGLGLFSQPGQAGSLKVAVKSFSSRVHIDPGLEVLDIEVGIGMTVCSTGWCTIRPSAFQKLIPVEVLATDYANVFEVRTLEAAKISKFKAFTTMRDCRVGLRLSVKDLQGQTHHVESTLFLSDQIKDCKASGMLTPRLQDHLDQHTIKVERAGVGVTITM